VGRVHAAGSRREFVGAAVELTKPRITRLVTITSAVGFIVGACGFGAWPSVARLVAAGAACLAGTALSAAGANAINQWMERRRDALMPRTSGRPLPTGRIEPATSLGLGVLLAAAGVTVLLALIGPAPALVSLATILLYTLVYTPLKPLTIWATIVGAVPGALPPLIGWTAAATVLRTSGGAWTARELFTPLLDAGGWSLFVLMVVWQLPHFWAIAWMYKDDYAKGGYRMLPIIDPSGRLTAWAIVLSALALVPALAWPAFAMPGVLSPAYTTLAIASGAGYFALAVPLLSRRDRRSARRVFIASVMHLPLILMVMVADALLVRLVF
jgi:protoheme IX farnesyltransferase